MKNTVLLATALLALAGCKRAADVASRNLSTAAGNFEIARRVVFYNGITGDYILSIEGLCALSNINTALRMSVTCKVGPNNYKKHLLGLSNNVTFFAEQISGASVSTWQYRVIFRPTTIVPNIDIDVPRP